MTSLRRAFLWLHAAWAALGLAASALLVFSGGGHPPPIILLPAVLAVWLVGHLVLGAAQWLVVRGATSSSSPARWSPSLLIAASLCGVATMVGLVQLVVTLLLGRAYPFRGSLWPQMMAIWSLHAICLVGLLLRKGWSRRATALLSFGWAALLAWQIVDHLWHQRPANPIEILIAIGLIAMLVVFGGRLLKIQDW